PENGKHADEQAGQHADVGQNLEPMGGDKEAVKRLAVKRHVSHMAGCGYDERENQPVLKIIGLPGTFAQVSDRGQTKEERGRELRGTVNEQLGIVDRRQRSQKKY